jgi:hypothetical protein
VLGPDLHLELNGSGLRAGLCLVPDIVAAKGHARLDVERADS